MSDVSAIKTPALFEAHKLRNAVVVSSGALIAFGAICWVAANWQAFHRLTKMGLVAGLLVASALIAAAAPRARAPALLVTVGAVGGMLALIGQSYPSGADAWQLFALWAALALPFALAARHDSVWSLWVLVASAGIVLWRIQYHTGRGLADWAPACGLAIMLAVLVSPYLPLQRIIGNTRWAFRLAALGAIALIGWEGLFDPLIRWSGVDERAYFAALAMLTGVSVALWLLRPLELGVLALAALGIDVLVIARLWRALVPRDDQFVPIFSMAILSSLIVGVSVIALREAAKRAPGAASGNTMAPSAPAIEESGFSWPLALLSGFGALLAAIPLLFSLGIALGRMLEQPSGATIVGLALLAGALFLLRGGQAFGFRQSFGMICALAALLLLTYGTGRLLKEDAGLGICLIAIAASFCIPTQGARSIFGFIASGALLATIFVRIGWRDTDAAIALTSMTSAAGAIGLVWPSLQGRDENGLLPGARGLMLGWTVACLIALIALAGRPFLFGAGSWVGEMAEIIRAPNGSIGSAASILLAIAGPALVMSKRTDLRTPVGVAVSLGGVALSVFCPTLGATIFILACAMLLPSVALSIAAALSAIWIVSALYYSLTLPLAQKGYGLMAMGALLGATLLATRREQVDDDRTKRSAVAFALIALGLVATGAIAGNAVRGSEDIIANGRQVFIGLRPVDPRSLVQGDYMALAFDTDRLPAPKDVKGEIVILGQVDQRGIATLMMPPDGATPKAGPDEILARVRQKSRRWFVGTDAFFFEEGKGSDYSMARYGIFRVGADGRLLLVGLADKDLKRLP